jgi:hypothetical protein
VDKARQAANEVLMLVRPMTGNLPWEAVAHGTLAIIADSEGDATTAAEEARSALDFDGETFIEQYIEVLWVAGRILIAKGEPEAAALSAEILGAFAYVSMAISDPDIKSRWFDVPLRRELTEIVGFELPESWEVEGLDDLQIDDDDLNVLRDIASGAASGDGASEADGEEAVSRLFTKLGVESDGEAIQFAIKAGVTWQ